MPNFIKTGGWESKKSGSKKELNLDLLISTLSPIVNLTAGANVLITGTYPNLTISASGGGGGGSVWGLITGTITDQTDLISYLFSNYTPLSRALSINGVSFDLSSNRSWSVGTVTDFSVGDLSPLFTSNVATSTSTPALTFTLSNVAARKWFGNNTSGSTTPSFNSVGSLTETNSSILTITGANSLLNDTSIEVKQANTSTSGYLSSTDWNTFNSKLSPTLSDGNIFIGNSSNIATSKTMSGDATLLDTGALTLATVNSNVGTFVATTVNGKGLVTAAAALSGDLTTSGAMATLATVNSNVGTFGSATKSVTATVNGKGLITAISEQTVTPAVGSITGLGTNVATFLATPSSANLASAVTDETGSGALVFATSPTLVTPALGTPSSITLTNGIGLPVSSGITGLGTGVATALGVNVGSAGAPVLFNGAGGTPSSLTLTNATGLPISGISGLGTNWSTALAATLASGWTTAFTTSPFTNPATTNGDLIYYDGSTFQRLAVGGSGTVLHGGTIPSYSAVVLTTDVSGWPANASGQLTNNGSGTLSWTTASSGWATSGTTTLGGVTTITNNTNNGLIFNGTSTASASTDYLVDFAGVKTSTSGGGSVGYKFDPQLVPVGTSSVQIGVSITPTFNVSGTNPINIGLDVAANSNITFSGRFQGALVAGSAATSLWGAESISAIKNQNAQTGVVAYNTTSGTGAGAQIVAATSSNSYIDIAALSAGYTTSGIFTASAGHVVTSMSAGLNIGSNSNSQVSLWTNNVKRLNVSNNGEFTFTQGNVSSTAFPVAITFTPGAITVITPPQEVKTNIFTGQSVTWLAGSATLATQRFNHFTAPTVNAGSGNTISNSYTISVDPPTNGSGTTTNLWGIGITGNFFTQGKIYVGGTAATPTGSIHIAAESASASSGPIKFTAAGALMSSPEALVLGPSVNGDYLNFTTTTNTIRRVIVAGSTGRATAQNAANTSVATYTLGATDASYEVSANVLVTTSSAENFTVTVDYTDEGNTSRTLTFNFQTIAGVIGTAINFANGAVPYEGLPVHLKCKASTAITVKTTGTFTGATYNVEGTIKQIN